MLGLVTKTRNLLSPAWWSSMFAEKLLRVDLPYSEYWLPLLIGMGVGLMAIVVVRGVFWRRSGYVPADTPKQDASNYDPFAEGSRSDQRRSYRRQGNPIRVHYCPPGRKDTPNEGFVIDRSMGGICLGTPDEVAPGTVLSIMPMNAPPMTPWVDIEVRSCRLVNEQYELGCQFVKVPPWSILLLFG